MQIEKKYWIPGLLNADDADFKIGETEYINNTDFRVGKTSDTGFAMQLESNGSTLLIPNDNLPTFGTNFCIGVAEDWANRRVIYFIWNSSGIHGIYCYDYIAGTIDLVLTDSQVTGGLTFDQYHLIHSARVSNGNVYWTDNLNAPRRLNIDAGIRMNLGQTPPIVEQFKTFTATTVAKSTFVGIITFLYTLPLQAYGPTIHAQLTVTGTTGPATIFDIPLNWSTYPPDTYQQVLAAGLNAFLLTLDPTNTQFSVAVSGSNVAVNVRVSWDWATGIAGFAPTVTALLQLYTLTTIYAQTPYIYIAPLTQSVISWIRRQPGLPLNAVKAPGGPGPVSLLTNEAFHFAYRYQYKNFEFSTLSPLSTLINYGVTSSSGSAINQDGTTVTLTVPYGEPIDQDVIQVDMVAQYLRSGIYFIIRSWNKNIPQDFIDITNHNNLVTQLTFLFTNDSLGDALDAAYSVKPFDSVPTLAQTLEFAKNRAFFGNYTIGYDTPTVSSLAISLDIISTSSTTTIVATVIQISLLGFGFTPPTTVYSLFLPGLGYYGTGLIGAPPSTLVFSSLTFQAADAASYNTLLLATYGSILFFWGPTTSTVIVTSAPSVPVSGISRMFKSMAPYKVAITFYDFAGRKCGYFSNDALKITTPERDVSLSSYAKGIFWDLDNTNALAEIPVWAATYSIDISLCLRTRFFIQSRTTNATYVTKDASGAYVYGTATYSPGLAGIAIAITYLQQQGMGYVFAQGDVCKIYEDTFPTIQGLPLNIIGQDSHYIICQLADVGFLNAEPFTGVGLVDWLFEIYTPYKPASSEPEYEVGQIYPITNPGTNTRAYSLLSGELNGDVSIISRTYNKLTVSTPVPTLYRTEAMNPSDAHYLDWFTDAGRPNFLDNIGQVTKISSVDWSNTFIAGSHTNGLSTFDALDTMDLSPDFGPIMKLQLSSKVQKIGTIMLAICGGSETASLYLSENTLISQTGESVVAQANAVIGSVHQLKGEFGTLNPESVIEFRGNVYWWDIQNGNAVQYADNGLFPITNYKLNRMAKLFSDQYKSMTPAAIAALGNRPFIFATVDPHHGEVLFTIPKTLVTPPRGFLPDYPMFPFPFDIWDGLGKTLVYKLYEDPNKWQGSYSFVPEYTFYLEDKLFSFKAGNLYVHNQTTTPYTNYYGQQFYPQIMFVSNQLPNKPKSYNNFSLESNVPPSIVYFMSLYEYLQSSDLVTGDFRNKEGIFYATILRNKLDPAFSGNFPAALIAGEKMRTTALYVMVQCTAIPGIVQIKYANLGFTVSLGQKV